MGSQTLWLQEQELNSENLLIPTVELRVAQDNPHLHLECW